MFFSWVLTVGIAAILVVVCYFSVHEPVGFISMLVISVGLIISALFYAPVYVEASAENVTMVSPLRHKQIPMADVEKVELYSPTMGAIRVFASGGFMGYWGIFSEGDIGRYYGFYGRSSDCFLVRTRTGENYVLGCENPEAMVRYIESQIG